MKCIYCLKKISYADYRVAYCDKSPDTHHHIKSEDDKE